MPKIFGKLLRRRNHSSGISRAGPTTTIIFFRFSVHLRALCREFYGTQYSGISSCSMGSTNRPLKCHKGLSESVSDTSERLIVIQKTTRVLLDTGSSGDLLFIPKGSQKYIPTMKRAVPQSWGTSNGTFKTNKVGDITLSFVDYSLSKSVHLTPDIVEYEAGATAPMYDLIIGKQTLHDIGAVLDFKEKTITIDSILLPMRNIVNLQLKPSVTRQKLHDFDFANVSM